MDDLNNEIKRFLSVYSKQNTSESNLEITVGHSLGKYIFDTHVSNKYWKKICDRLERNGEYTVRREFEYKIYTDYNMKLYKSADKMKCVVTDVVEQSLCYNNTGGFDFKITLSNKKPVNTAKFPSKYDYHGVVDRHTVSYNFDNQFYINVSSVNNVENKLSYHQVVILLAKNTKASRNIVLKNIMRQIREIYGVTRVKPETFNISKIKE